MGESKKILASKKHIIRINRKLFDRARERKEARKQEERKQERNIESKKERQNEGNTIYNSYGIFSLFLLLLLL